MADGKEEFGWVIEDGNSPVSAPLYFSGRNIYGELKWSSDNQLAVRFCRKEDAMRMVSPGEHIRICEHGWG